jgi:hypothetical protein
MTNKPQEKNKFSLANKNDLMSTMYSTLCVRQCNMNMKLNKEEKSLQRFDF